MRFGICLFVILLHCPFGISSYTSSAITNDNWTGRFGDQLCLYTKTKWFAYKHNLQFFCRPFIYFDKLALYNCEKQYNPEVENLFKNKIKLSSENDIKSNKKESVLYKCDFFSSIFSDFDATSVSQICGGMYHNLYEIIIKNPLFAKSIRELIQPLIPLPSIGLPKDKITIALHIRKGGGAYDDIYLFRDLFKSPPEQYYIDQVKKLYALLDGEALYIFLFTDDPNPKNLVEAFEKECINLNITFSCREYGNHHSKNVVEDFFTMTKFDCLIRGQSSYSVMAQCIGNYKIIIEPWSYHREGKKVIMDDIKIVLPDYEKMIVHYFSFDLSNQELKILAVNKFNTILEN